jgi:hypothetical protein
MQFTDRYSKTMTIREIERCSSIILAPAVLWLAGCSSPSAGWKSVWKSNAVYHDSISDPMAWAATQFMDSSEASVQEAQLEKFEADLDLDGTPEWFVTSWRLHGNALGPYLVFRRAGLGFRYIGLLGMQWNLLKVLPPGPDKRPRVMTCVRNGGGELGSVVFTMWANDGARFIEMQSEELDGAAAQRRYEVFFHQ